MKYKKKKKLGVSWTPELLKIWGEIRNMVDSVEFANLSDLGKVVSENWTFHYRKRNSYDMGSGRLNLVIPKEVKNSFEGIREFLSEKKPRIISAHLGLSCEEAGKMQPDNHNYAQSKVLAKEEVKARILESLEYLTSSTETPIAIENLDYHQGGAYEYVCEPDFIREILERNPKVFLLLDIAHAQISAVELQEARPEDRLEITREYLRQLPLEKVIQLHINAPVWKNGQPLDMHLPMTEIEKSLIKELIALPNLEVVNLECGQDIEKQIRWLSELIR